MGIYLNPGNRLFGDSVEARIYVDKSNLIKDLWRHIKDKNKYVCFSRPRRFGKSTDANMLAAYFSKGCDSKEIFDGLNIAGWDEYEKHLNKYNVVKLNIQEFISKTHNVTLMTDKIRTSLLKEFKKQFDGNIDGDDISDIFNEVFSDTDNGFIFIIDEWDCIFREFKDNKDEQEKYLDYLRLIFKDQPYVDMVYMTGILPIKKYGTHSALNMFDEISILDSDDFSEYMGFTDREVRALCEEYDVDYDIMKSWYDGYRMHDGISTYCPRSVCQALLKKRFGNYWSQTETYEALRCYIDLNFDGLKDAVIKMLAGETVPVKVNTFQNDMVSFKGKDDVFTLLIHLGYLGYIMQESSVYIPNNEVKDTFIDSVEVSDWGMISKVFENSRALLEATLDMQSDRVAAYIQNSHYETSILQYNDENALAYTVSLAYIVAKQHYNIVRELPSGKGFADIVFIPKKNSNKPAMIIELKYDKAAETGINQIKDKKYYLGLEDFTDNLLLVAISYDKDTKEHSCVIGRYN